MLTGKERAALRAQANELDTTLIIGKEGITGTVLEQTVTQLDARELIKGRVLETAMLTAREASDALCEKTGAEGIQTVGSKFVIYRKSLRKEQEAAKKAKEKKIVNPVRKGAQKRREAARQEREKKNDYFKKAAIDAAIARAKANREE